MQEIVVVKVVSYLFRGILNKYEGVEISFNSEKSTLYIFLSSNYLRVPTVLV